MCNILGVLFTLEFMITIIYNLLCIYMLTSIMASRFNGHELRETVKDREAWHAAVREVAKSRTQLSDWTTISY